MTKTKKTQPYKRIIYILSTIFVISVAVLIILIMQNKDDTTDVSSKDNAINVELGSYRYNFQGTNAVKISNENVTSLDNFLTIAAQNDISKLQKIILLGCGV